MDTFDKDLEQMLHQATLELSPSRKAVIRQSLRESRTIKTNSRVPGLFRKRLGTGLAAVTAVFLVGVFTFAVRTHWVPTSQSVPGDSQPKNTSSLLPNTPPYDYKPLLGFQPMLPSKNFKLAQATSYVFKYVNPPWGKKTPTVMETWGKDVAYDAMYLAPNGSGKSFTIMETAMDASTPPDIGTPWTKLQSNGTVFYQNTLPGTTSTTLAMPKNGVLYVVTRSSQFTPTELEQILQSLSIPVKNAPEMINTQTFGFSQAPKAVPFTALLPKIIPFKPSTSSAAGVSVKSYGYKNSTDEEGRLTLTYTRGKTQLKILEAIGMKYINPNVAGASNGVKVHLQDGDNAVYIDGGEGITMIDGGSSNRRAITWTTKAGVNITIVASQDLSKSDLLGVANSLQNIH
jgi:hypothetical protein